MNAAALENGNVLVNLLRNFAVDKTSRNAMFILQCLRDSSVFVSCAVQISDEDTEQFQNTNKGDVVEIIEDMVMIPEILIDQATQESVFPVFSQEAQIPPDYRERFSQVKMPFINVCEMVGDIDDVNMIVVDPFTFCFKLGRELMNIAVKLPTTIDEE